MFNIAFAVKSKVPPSAFHSEGAGCKSDTVNVGTPPPTVNTSETSFSSFVVNVKRGAKLEKRTGNGESKLSAAMMVNNTRNCDCGSGVKAPRFG